MKTIDSDAKGNTKLLILIVIFGLLLRLIFSVGIMGSGDLVHIYYSYKASLGDFRLTLDDPQTASRIGFNYPVAFFYWIFGINEFSAYAFSLFMGTASIFLIYYLGRLFFNERAAIISAFLLSFYPLNVNYSTQAFPDLAGAFLTGLAVFFFFLGEKKSGIKQQAVLYSLSGIAIGLSILIKESGIIILFFFGIYIMYKLVFEKQKIRASYFLIGVALIMVILLQLLHSYYVNGDAFLRYRQVDKVYYEAVKNLYNYQGYKLIERLFVHIPYMMLTNVNFGFFTIFLLVALSYVVLYRKKEAFAVTIWFVSLFLYLNFGSTSLTSYVPLPGGSPRYLEMLTFPGILMIAFFLSEKKDLIMRLIAPFTIVFLLITSIGFIYLNPDRNSTDTEKELADFINKLDDKVIFVDVGTIGLLQFFTEYKKDVRYYWTAHYPYTGSTEVIKPEEMRDAYVVINWHMINKIPENYKVTYPRIFYEVPENWILIKHIKNKEGDAFVYYAP